MRRLGELGPRELVEDDVVLRGDHGAYLRHVFCLPLLILSHGKSNLF